MQLNNSGINLKDNIFISVHGTVGKNARKMISSSLPFISESEAKWYVFSVEEDSDGEPLGPYRDYLNAGQTKQLAKDSLRSAVKKLANGQDPDKVKINIFSM
jgi:hypothetical protein